MEKVKSGEVFVKNMRYAENLATKLSELEDPGRDVKFYSAYVAVPESVGFHEVSDVFLMRGWNQLPAETTVGIPLGFTQPTEIQVFEREGRKISVAIVIRPVYGSRNLFIQSMQ